MKARVYRLETNNIKHNYVVTLFKRVFIIGNYKAYPIKQPYRQFKMNRFKVGKLYKTNTYIDIVKTGYLDTKYEYYHIKGEMIDE